MTMAEDRTDAHYGEMLDEITAVMGSAFVHELDEVVDARMAGSQDAVPLGGIIEARFAALAAEVAELREQMATEVRTRRLVVVDEGGFEAIVAEAKGDVAKVVVTCRDDTEVWSSLSADGQGGEFSSGLYLSGGGNGLGVLDVYKRVINAGTKDEVISYFASLDLEEAHGQSVSLRVDGLDFRR